MSQLMYVRKIGAAVRLMDGFTGQPADHRGILAAMDDGALPVRKSDGYFIFWDNGRQWRTLVVKGAGYEQEEVLLDMEALGRKGQPTCCVWLKPGRTYAYPPEIRLEERREEPDKEVVFPLEASAGCIKLAEAYPVDRLNTDMIYLQVPEGIEMENRRLCIRSMEGKEEDFTIWMVKNRAMGLYMLKEPLEGIYGPYETEILLTLVLRADKQGCLAVPAGY